VTQVLIASTWLLWILSTMGIGLGLISLFRLKIQGRSELQSALWMGFFALVIFVLILNFFSGTGKRESAWLTVVWVGVGFGICLLWCVRRRGLIRGSLLRTFRLANWPALALGATLLLAGFVMTSFAAAEPMDYDAGLYRMGLINYAAEYPVIPGLANLHDRFGFNSFLGPLAGLMGTGLWQGEGFRLITGFFVSALFFDVALRTAVPRTRTPGDYFLVIAAGFVCWVVLTDSGRWIPSPAVDVIALVLTAVVIGYLADFASSRGIAEWQIPVLVLVAALAASVRPLAWILIPLLLAAIVLAYRGRIRVTVRRPRFQLRIVASLLAATLLLVIMLLRDAIISGWLLFPMSIFPLSVDWITPDPTGTRLGITWYARAGTNMAEAQQTGWLAEWIRSFINSQEVKAWGLLIVASIVPLAWLRGRQAWEASWYPVLITILPPAVLTLVWFVSAPDVRFNWGGLLGISAVPLAFILTRAAYPAWVLRSAFIALLIFGIVTNTRNGRLEPRGREPEISMKSIFGQDLPLQLGAPNQVSVVPGNLGDGTPIVYPAEGENCYMVFPLCLLPGGGTTVEQRGSSIESGFRQQ